MAGMLRRGGRILLAINLLLLAGIVVLWTRSTRHMDVLGYVAADDDVVWISSQPHALSLTRAADQIGILFGLGGRRGFSVVSFEYSRLITVDLSQFKPPSGMVTMSGTITFTIPPPPTTGPFGGFSHQQSFDATGGPLQSSYTVPLWFVTLLLAAWPVWAVVRLVRRRRRFAEGLCQVCGYDLRETPSRCPECGTASPKGTGPLSPPAA